MIFKYNSDFCSITVETEPVVTHDCFVEVVNYGKVKATFDFSELDEKAHQMVLNHIISSSISLIPPLESSM